MAVTPTGILSLPLEYLRDLIAGTSAFQTWVGAASEAAAKASIYVMASNDDAYVRPCAIVTFASGSEWTPPAMGPYGLQALKVFFEADVTEANSGHQDAAYEFTNPVGAIISEMYDDAGTPGKLIVRKATLLREPGRCGPHNIDDDAETVEDFYQAVFMLQCGASS